MTAFRVLFREFVSQFFASESVTSDIRLRQVIFAIVAALVAPPLFLSTSSFATYEFARRHAPELLVPMTRMRATLFLTYAMVATGLAGAILWDALAFDRRDAMVLGPLPIARGTVVSAKLAALGAFLLGTCVCLNLFSAVSFATVANGSAESVLRHAAAHTVATSAAASFVFALLVVLRALVAMAARRHAVAIVGSIVQFGFLCAVFGVVILAPFSMNARPLGHNRYDIFVRTVPAWLPSRFFLAAYEQLRGTADAAMATTGLYTEGATVAMLVAAVLLTRAAYNRQFQSAVSVPTATHPFRAGRIVRGLASLLAGPSPAARAIADFVLTTLGRNRRQQSPITMNLAIGFGLVLVRLMSARVRASGGLLQSPDVLLAIPLMLAYWSAIGMRASYFVPAELPASWAFHVNAKRGVADGALGTRAAMATLVGLPTTILSLAAARLVLGWSEAIAHAFFAFTAVVVLSDVLMLTVNFQPYTRSYLPGHAKLKSRWPLYLAGAYWFSDGTVWLERTALSASPLVLALVVIASLVLLEAAVRSRGRNWNVQSADEIERELSTVTTLDLGGPVPIAS